MRTFRSMLGLSLSLSISMGGAVTSVVAAPAVIVEDYSTQFPSADQRDQNSTASMGLGERVKLLEQQVDSQKILNLINRIDELERDLSELRGQVEVQNHQLALLKGEKISRPVAPVETSGPAPVSSELDTGEKVGLPVGDKVATSEMANPDQLLKEQKMYMVAYERLKTKQYPEAVEALDQYLRQYPIGRYVTHAHYWLGEVYFIQSQWDLANEQFDWVMQNAPKDQKAADALLKIGFIQANQKKWQDAQSTLNTVKQRYPDSLVARLADTRLTQIKKEAGSL